MKKRDKAIQKLLGIIQKDKLMAVVAVTAPTETHNYPLQLLNVVFQINETQNNWFTALGVLVEHQRVFAGAILQKANLASGNPPMSQLTKAELIDAIASGSKLTKADAG